MICNGWTTDGRQATDAVLAVFDDHFAAMAGAGANA